MKQSSLLSFFGNSQRRKKEEMEKDQRRLEESITQSQMSSQSKNQSLKDDKDDKDSSMSTETEIQTSKEFKKTNLKRPKLVIDSDEEDQVDIKNIEDLDMFTNPNSKKSSFKKGIISQKSDIVNEDEDPQNLNYNEEEDNIDDEDFATDEDYDQRPKKKINKPVFKTPVKNQVSKSKSNYKFKVEF